ncbi:glutamate racemase [Belliella marina]|uniref:Glutamate racemase n=1 Tax=Belliella marina TaxID=1644146 RepID=A0ABW4VTU2_9BACT
MSDSIGIFDSGVGGMTLLVKLLKALPGESFEYYADSGNCPYGEKSVEEILSHTIQIMDYLTQKNCKLIIVACNTISTNIIDKLRAIYPVPIVGMEPGTKPAYKISKNKRIGILATKGTLSGLLYNKTLDSFKDKAIFISEIGHGLVELIENDKIESLAMRERLTMLLKPMVEQQVDTLVLGCTHYNYLTSIIHDIVPYPIEVIDTTDAVSNHVVRILYKKGMVSTDQKRLVNIVTTGDLEILGKMVERLKIHEPNLSIDKLPAPKTGI